MNFRGEGGIIRARRKWRICIHCAFGDKIYPNRKNRKILKTREIEIMGRPLGRPPKNPTDEQIESERITFSLRDVTEAQFGTGKRAYRPNNIRF
ncbi:MAG: transposase [Duncaniella sp.]|nr:transposase [Duncaniella sp.]